MSYRALLEDIKKNQIKSLYLVYGDETYLIDKAWESLRNAVVTDFPELNYTILQGEDLNADALAVACETFPFVSEKRLVAVRDLHLLKPSGKSEGEEGGSQGSGDVQSFVELVKNIPESTCLLLVSYGAIDKRKKIVNEIKKHGALYEMGRIEREDLVKWIRKYLDGNGKKIGPKEMDGFIEASGYLDKNGSKTLYDLENELGKLVGFMGEETQVSQTHIQTLIPRNPENDIFKLINACSEKKVSDSLRIYGDQILEGESSLGMLALLSRQIKNMLGVSELYAGGMDSRRIAERLRIHEYTVKLCIKYGGGIGKEKLKAALDRCLRAEMMIKTGKMGERLAVEMLLVGLFE